MNPVIDQLFKIEQIAQDMESGVEERKEALRAVYKQKHQEFDRDSDKRTQEQLERIRKESEQQRAEANRKILTQYQTEEDRLETVYRLRKNQIVQSIFTKIIKG